MDILRPAAIKYFPGVAAPTAEVEESKLLARITDQAMRIATFYWQPR